MMSILKKLTLATAAASMLMLGPISIGDNMAKADRDGWRGNRGWYGNNYYRRGIPGDGWRGRSYWGGYYRPNYYYQPYSYYRPYYSPYYSYQPWYNIYQVPGYSPYGVQVW
jgi:hypothetical protein